MEIVTLKHSVDCRLNTKEITRRRNLSIAALRVAKAIVSNGIVSRLLENSGFQREHVTREIQPWHQIQDVPTQVVERLGHVM